MALKSRAVYGLVEIHLEDYEIAIWDQESFDVESVPYVREACAARRWAFAADYIRLWALYHYGGIYLDLDS